MVTHTLTMHEQGDSTRISYIFYEDRDGPRAPSSDADGRCRTACEVVLNILENSGASRACRRRYEPSHGMGVLGSSAPRPRRQGVGRSHDITYAEEVIRQDAHYYVSRCAECRAAVDVG